jgi:hypothetical protein
MKENANGKNIDLLFLDIEGMELPVLLTLDFREFLPFVIFNRPVFSRFLQCNRHSDTCLPRQCNKFW